MPTRPVAVPGTAAAWCRTSAFQETRCASPRSSRAFAARDSFHPQVSYSLTVAPGSRCELCRKKSAPYHWTWVKAAPKLETNSEQATVVKRIFTMYAEGFD